MTALYRVRCQGPEPTWVKRDANTKLPTHTFIRPQGLPHSDALALKGQAAITCGGTLRLERVRD